MEFSKLEIFLLGFLMGGIICYFLIILSVEGIVSFKSNSKPEITKFEECANLSLSESAYCFVSYVKTFYNFTEREDIPRTLEDLKENGGDCFDYSNIYFQMTKDLGFNAQFQEFWTDNKGHRFVTIWNNDLTEYCNIDLLNVNCASFPDEEPDFRIYKQECPTCERVEVNQFTFGESCNYDEQGNVMGCGGTLIKKEDLTIDWLDEYCECQKCNCSIANKEIKEPCIDSQKECFRDCQKYKCGEYFVELE